ncbi:MAG TPA: hypothetical protein VFQ77_17325 [Pseudonocardiaceae bacterium]|nr:hypothetical protein [Pseudonocardiaceae bacterium]
MTEVRDLAFCDACGRPAGEGEHLGCARRRELEPPRYCPRCARRMVVQVTPAGWSARCSVHGAAGRGPEPG